MVPHYLQPYFTTAAELSGTLIGLLFVSISLRYDAIFVQGYRLRAAATAAFVSLVSALVISLWALLPAVDLGYPAAVAGAVAVGVTLRTHIGPTGRRDTSTTLFVASLVGQSAQIALAATLITAPHDRTFVEALTYVVFYAIAIGLLRAWQLLQPERVPQPDRVPQPEPDRREE